MSDDERLDEFIRVAEGAIGPRSVVIAAAYLASLTMLEVPIGKSALICAMVYLFLRLPLGRRHIDRFAFILFFAAAAYWMDVVPLKRWGHLTVQAIDLRISDSAQVVR